MGALISAASMISVLGLVLAPAAWAQSLADRPAERGPRFLLASASASPAKLSPVDVGRTPILKRKLSLDLRGTTVAEALVEVSNQSGLTLVYSDDVVAGESQVDLRADGISVAAALTEVLLDAGVDVVFESGSRAALVRRPPPAQEGTIVGRVTDRRSGEELQEALVRVEGTALSASTRADGGYRIPNVPVGSHTVSGRRVGYGRQSHLVTVVANQETTADFALEQAPTQLEELVTTGTVVSTEVRALPTPVTVLTADDIALRRPYDLGEVLREVVPTAVSPKFPAGSPTTTFFQVRGATSLAGAGGQMKIFVDGIESADRLNGGVDPNSIERVEVIRGPQAASIYGSNAIGGVVQIFTKRGDSEIAGPRVSGEAGWGLVQTPYAGFDGVLRQTYSASVRGGGADGTYRFGASYGRTNPYVPEGRLSNGGVTGGVHITRGMMSVDLSGRYFVYRAPTVFNPELSESGFFDFASPYYTTYEEQDQALGARVSLAPTSWWQHEVAAGFDRSTGDVGQRQPRRTFPEDTLLFVNNRSSARSSIRYNTSVHGALSSTISGVMSLGADYYRFPSTDFFFGGLLRTDGSLQFAPGSEITSASRTVTTNAGYFAQTQLGFRDALFLTAGLRAERNSEFGDSLGTPLSPRVGLSFVHPLGGVTLKLRGAWGRAILPPSAGLKLEYRNTSTDLHAANPTLGPARQQGWDGGLDAVFGSRGSLSLTYYDQRADNLIAPVTLATTPARITQHQNVGRVKNTGFEVEGGLALGPAQLKGQYGYTRSRIEQLAPDYAGDLRVGDQVRGQPRHTAGASATLGLSRGPSIGGGLTYVGSRSEYDWLAFYGCLGGTGPCRNDTFALDEYITVYPGFVKVNVAISQQFTRSVSGFVRVENLSNNEAFEVNNFIEVTGRITTIGVSLGE